MENVKVKSNDKTIATASYDSNNGIITIKGIKKGTTTISVSANGCKTALIQITVFPIAKNIIINKKWGIISGNNKTTFVILNNSLLKNLKINSDNKNISFDYNQKTGSVSVYSNDGLGYWATITKSAKIYLLYLFLFLYLIINTDEKKFLPYLVV